MLKNLVRNFTALFTGETIARLCHFASVIYVARILGASGFGVISFSFALVYYFLIVTNLGLGELGVREISRKRDVRDIAETILSARLAIATFSFLAVILIALLLRKAPQTKAVIAIFGLMLFPYALSLEWVFRGVERMKYNACGKALNAIVYVLLIFLLVRRSDDAAIVAVATIVADTVVTLFYYVNYRRKFGPLRLHLDLKKWLPLIAVSSQLFFSAAMLIISLNFGMLALGLIRDEYTVGIYGAAYRIAFALYPLSDLLVAAVFPAMSRSFHESRETFSAFLGNCVKFTMVFGLPLGVGGAVLGSRIIEFVYGPSYAGAGTLLRVMSFFIAINLTSFVLSYSLVACDRQRVYFRILGTSALVNIAGNLIGIPFVGYFAPAVALVAAELVTLALSWREVRKVFPGFSVAFPVKPLIASLLMGVVSLLLFRMNIVPVVAISAAFYAAALFALGGITKRDIAKFKEALA